MLLRPYYKIIVNTNSLRQNLDSIELTGLDDSDSLINDFLSTVSIPQSSLTVKLLDEGHQNIDLPTEHKLPVGHYLNEN